jgi:hypothetical protein
MNPNVAPDIERDGHRPSVESEITEIAAIGAHHNVGSLVEPLHIRYGRTFGGPHCALEQERFLTALAIHQRDIVSDRSRMGDVTAACAPAILEMSSHRSPVRFGRKGFKSFRVIGIN